MTLPANGTTELSVPAGFQGFAYLLDGRGSFGSNRLEAVQHQIVVLGDSDQLAGQTSFPVRTHADGLRFVLAAAQPIGETPRWNANFVD